MITSVQICNMALGHVGAYRIQSLSEDTKEARTCNIFYEQARDATLEAHDWGFARKRQTLALLTDTYTGWDYAYAYPSDCICVRKIDDSTGANTGTSYDIDNGRYVQVGKVEYEICTNSTKSGKVILTDKTSAELIYTARITDTNLFTASFNEALSYKLAAFLAMPLKADKNLQLTMAKAFAFAIGQAKAQSANEEQQKPDEVNVFFKARG